MENSEAPMEDLATPGQQLRAARERVGISPREMADQLNWSPTHVSAIEEDRYESLRNHAFVRGYLRAYARALGLDGDALVRSFEELTGSVGDRQQTAVVPTSPAGGQKTGLSVVTGMVIAVLVLVLIWWQSGEDQPPVAVTAPAPVESTGLSASSGSEALEPAASEAGLLASEAETVADESAGSAEPVESGAPLSRASADTPPEAAVGQGAAALVDTAPGSGEGAASDAPLPNDEAAGEAAIDPVEEAPAAESAQAILVFDFNDDCWLEVRDAEGALIYADLRRAGETVRLDGSPPFDVLAGNAAGVTLRFRGEPFTFSSLPGRRKAKFTVGDP